MPSANQGIRRKIKSVVSTRQITKAMELVAASKMQKAISMAIASRSYAESARLILRHISQTPQEIHPLLHRREPKNILVYAISTDRGLCGGMNMQLFKKILDFVSEQHKSNPKINIEFVAVGKKAQDFLRRNDLKVVAAFPSLSNNPALSDTFPLSNIAINDFASEKYDKVILMYTDFISPLRQKVSVRRLLPLSRVALEEMVDMISNLAKDYEEDEKEKFLMKEYVFEPSESEILEPMLYRLCEMQIFQAILESTASEHSARMIAMRNASDNATDLIDGLTLVYNQARQTSITAEIAEISSAMAVLGK